MTEKRTGRQAPKARTEEKHFRKEKVKRKRGKRAPVKPKIIKRAKTGKPGQPPFEPSDEDRKMVEGMVGMGLRRSDVANLMGVDPKTLKAHFPTELRNGSAKVIHNVGTGLYINATTPTKRYPGGDVGAQVFILKCQGGWKETSRHEVTGPDGEPIAHAHEIKDLEKLPIDELVRLYQQATAAPDRG